MPYIDPEIVAQTKRIDLLTYLQERDPEELVRVSASTWCTREHDSLKISNGKWYWWSRGFGGRSALDYLIKVRGMSFLDAVRDIAGDAAEAPAARPLPPRGPAGPVQRPARRPFELPPADATPEAVAYLARRGIAREVLDECVSRGIVYGTRRGRFANAVFVGTGPDGRPRYAALRGCSGSFKGEAPGSDKRCSFHLDPGRGGELHVFEAAIDALSYATLAVMRGEDWRSLNLLSLGGVPPASVGVRKGCVPPALERHLADRPRIRSLRLHLDNDAPGLNAAALVSTVLCDRYRVAIEPPRSGKDVNEELMLALGRGRATAGRAR